MQNNLRIALISHSFHPGLETFVWRHIKALSADVIVENLYEDGLKHRSWRPYVASLYKEKRGQESLARHTLRRLKEVCFGIAAPRWSKGMEDVWDRFVRERRPHVALAEFAPNGIKAMQALHRHKIPLVVHFHGYDASSLLRIRSYRQCLPDLFRNSAAIVAVSHHMRKTLERLGCPSSKLHVIPCGAPVDEFPVSDAVNNQPCRFIAVSSFTPMKGTLYTLRAFAQCVNQCPEINLTMIGGGKQFQKAKRWVKRAGLSNKVNFLGHQPIKVVQEYMAKSRVFVQHSVTIRIGHVEGWGVSLAELRGGGRAWRRRMVMCAPAMCVQG